MAHAFAKVDVSAQSEYSVYIYHRPENQQEGQNDWEMRTITPDLNIALDDAEALHQSQSFRKVEVKQRLLDHKTEQLRDYTLKIFVHSQYNQGKSFLLVWFLAFALGAGAVIAVALGLS